MARTPAQLENDANPLSPPPANLPSPRSGSLMFNQPDPTNIDLPDDSLSPSADRLDAPSDPSEAGPRSSTGSSAKAPSTASKRALRDAVRAGVMITGSLANEFLARDQATATVGLYRTDEQDAEAIGDPIASIVNRHGGIGTAGNPDLADAIAALIGLALYARKQLSLWLTAKEHRRFLAAGGTQDAPAEDSAGDRAQDDSEAAHGAPVSSGAY